MQNIYHKGELTLKENAKKLTGLLPGLTVCIIIAVLSQYISSFVPSIGSALFAIGIGILCGNTFLNKDSFNTGTKFSESRLLEYSIVLTGLTLQLSDITGVGISGVLYIALMMSATITATYLIGRYFGFKKRFCLLMSAGNAVCGSSAIGTVSPVLKADSKDKGISITIVNVTGTVLMVLLPILAEILYKEETLRTSALIGGVLQSIGQVIASAKFINEEVVQMATIFKIIRIVFLIVIAFIFSRMNTAEDEKLFRKPDGAILENEGSALKKAVRSVPWFIIGFFLLSIIHTTGIIPSPISYAAKRISGQFEIIALAAIGMRVKFHDLVKEGPRSMIYGGCVGVMQMVAAALLIAVLFGR